MWRVSFPRKNPVRAASVGALTVGLTIATAATAGVPACRVAGTAIAPPVIELYTSEGCSSCPPADRWLSRLAPEPASVVLAFHVDYWDRLGWKDRFANAAYTERQARQQAVSGARFSYTPQVIVDGIDRPDWPHAAFDDRRVAAPVGLTLQRIGDRVTAAVDALPGAPPRLAAYWAVTEQGHVSEVRAGENQGATLRHDHVVRDYRPVPAWNSQSGASTELRLDLPGPADPAHPRDVNLVIVDASTGRPVQALRLGC